MSGVGISPADIERVFEPFVQADANFDRANSGTGLGLPLSRKLVELHGGTLHLESTAGRRHDGDRHRLRVDRRDLAVVR